MRPLKIISGGQTGVDRAALDVAIELGIPHQCTALRGARLRHETVAAEESMKQLDRVGLDLLHAHAFRERRLRAVAHAPHGVSAALDSDGPVGIHDASAVREILNVHVPANSTAVGL